MIVNGTHYYKSLKEVILDIDRKIISRTTKVMFKYNNEWIETSGGRLQVFNVTGFLIDYDLDKKGVSKLINSIYNTYEPEEAARVIKLFQDLILDTVTSYGLTLGADDFEKSEDYNHTLSQAYELASTKPNTVERAKVWDTAINGIVDDWKSAVNHDNPLYIMMQSGARVTDTQVRQMVVAKGLLTTMTGELNNNAVHQSLADGLDPIQYFMTAGPARKGLANNFFLVPASGYLERQLVNVCRDLTITTGDCGTDEGIMISSKDARGRYMIDGTLITEDNMKTIPEKVRVRSPIKCKHTKGLCKKCCGVNPATNKDWWDNVGIGVIAGQTLSEYTTQLALRGKHTSGSVTLSTYSNRIDTSLADAIKLMGAQSTVAVKVSDSAMPHPSDVEGKTFDEKALNLVNMIHSIYLNAGAIVARQYIEIVVRAMSDIVELPDGSSGLRSRGTKCDNPKILGVGQALRSHPSWLKSMEFGYVKSHIVRAITTLEPTLGLPSENLLEGRLI